jgi:ClpP class serine protease
MTTLKARFEAPPGALLAIAPAALGLEHSIWCAPAETFNLVADGKAAVVSINGPLAYAAGQFLTYDAIRTRFDQALASSADCVVLKINSPGGEVSGTFDTSRYMRARAAAAGKTLLTYVEAQASSSGYALASAGSQIFCSETASLGSIGVIQCMKSEARAAQAAGIDFAVITSGARKADGNPLVPISDEARESAQASVDTMAGLFFDLVREHRGIDAKPLEARSLTGAGAVTAGLADGVLRWDSFVDAIAAGTLGARTPQEASAAKDSNSMPDDDKDKDKPAEDAVRAALVTASGSDDPEKKARATRALAAYDEDEKKKAASDKPPCAEDDKPAPKDDDKDKDKPESKALAALSAQLTAQATSFAAFQAEVKAEKDAALKVSFLASRPDLSAETLKALAGESLESCKKIVALIPVTPGFKSQVPELARAAATGKLGEGDRSDPETVAFIKQQMGLTAYTTTASYDANTRVQTFGAVAPAKAVS